MDRHFIIAAEFKFAVDDEMPIYRFQQLSEYASAERDRRRDAAAKGLIYTG